MLAAFNRGDLRRFDRAVAPEPWFGWWSTTSPGARLGHRASSRASLVRYVAARHRRHERLRLLQLRYNGNDARGGHFAVRLVRRADGLPAPPWVGKGAVRCAHPAGVIVWSTGRDGRRVPPGRSGA